MGNFKKPFFIITIDTEGDNLWSKPKEITTYNAKYIERFQNLCEKYCFRPTYLVNYEMAIDPLFRKLAKKWIKENRAEIGMHLHAWNTPPLHRLTEDDFYNQPLLIEYPVDVMRQKLEFMTRLLEDTFEVRVTSHRAGRWGFNETYAKLLVELGYKVDCSVTPGISWERVRGGPNYKGFPTEAYFVNLDNIRERGKSDLLEVPVSIVYIYSYFVERLFAISEKLAVTIGNKLSAISSPKLTWLRPKRNNLKYMLRLLDRAISMKWTYVEFMLHSSELMPGGSPRFKTQEAVDKLYHDIEALFRKSNPHFEPATLSEFYQQFCDKTLS